MLYFTKLSILYTILVFVLHIFLKFIVSEANFIFYHSHSDAFLFIFFCTLISVGSQLRKRLCYYSI